ncbi:MAG: tRNA lysidine(34) synthetase TilS [Kofleriaceae bacterium]
MPVDAIRATVAAALARHGRRRVDVAFSGGPDSSVVADAAAAALGAGQVRLLHVDHRAPASASAAAHARAWGKARGLAVAVAAVDVPAGPSWEAQARVVRDRALAELSEGELILTGHTASDQAETVLLRLVRGTGVDGLAAIAPRRGAFVRPLLPHTRAEVEAYAAAAGLAPWRDPMNDDERFTRVWVRRQVLPLLASRNPQIERSLARLADQAADDRLALAAAAAHLAEAATVDDRLACAPLAAAAPALARRVIGAWLAAAGRSVEHDHVEAVRALAARAPAGTVGLDVPGGRIERVYDHLVVAGAPAPATTLTVLGAEGPYAVRPWRPGDRMRPARLRGASRKLSDLFIDGKVPRAARAQARVVVAADGAIVWAEHVGPAWQRVVAVAIDLPR